MSALLIQDAVGSIHVFLEATDGTAATGLTTSDIQVDLKKAGESSFTNKVLSGADLADLGSGFYEIDLSATDTDTLGTLAIRVTGATIKSMVVTAQVVTSTPESPTPEQSVNVTTIFGYLKNADGTPLVGASVAAKVLSQPTVLHSGSEGLVLGTELVTSESDSSGYFLMSLVAGSTVDLFIPAANYRRTFLVPATSTNVFDIP